MSNVVESTIIALALWPLPAIVVCAMLDRVGSPPGRRWTLAFGFLCVSFGLALASIAAFAPQLVGEPLIRDGFAWMTLPDSGRSIMLGLRIDRLGLIGCASVSVWTGVTLMVAGGRVERSIGTVHIAAAIAAFFMMMFSVSLWQTLIAWQLLAVAITLLQGIHEVRPGADIAAVRRLLIGLVADLPMWFAVYLIWQTIGTTDLRMLLEERIFAQLHHLQPELTNLLLLGVVSSVAGRCALFPVLGWLKDSSRGSREWTTVLVGAIFLPSGVWLLLRMGQLYSLEPVIASTTSTLGVASLVMLLLVAIVQPTIAQAVSYVSASLCAGALIAMANGHVIATLLIALLGMGGITWSLLLAPSPDDAVSMRTVDPTSARPVVSDRWRAIKPFADVARRGFHLDEILFFGVSLPVRFVAQCGRFIDWVVIDQIILGSVRRVIGAASFAVASLERESPSFYAVATLLTLGVSLGYWLMF